MHGRDYGSVFGWMYNAYALLNILYYTLIEERCPVITNGDSVDTEVIDICVNKRHGVVSIDF